MRVLTCKVPLSEKMQELKAKEYALRCHAGQKYGTRDYSIHLQSVVNTAKEFDLPEEVVVSCWLHDVIEDCDITYQDIKMMFGKEIAEIVYLVTDELGRNRKERKAKTYPKIKSSEKALCVKLCDRISNIRQALHDENDNVMKMYVKEHEEFRFNLYSSAASDMTLPLWAELDSLMERVEM